MTTNHTPGPWAVETEDGYTSVIFGGILIAEVDGGEAEYLDNARLIAAAPELLKALNSARILLTCVESCSRNNFTNLADEEVEAIDAVIAKATGGASC